MKRSSAVAVIVDRTAYDVRYSYTDQTDVWNSRGQHEYLLIYSFELKSAFGARQLFAGPLVAKRYILQQKFLKK